jgi:hypothetical protein
MFKKSPYGVPRILLLAQAFYSTIEGAEQSTPRSEVATERWRAHLDRCDGSYPSLSVRTISETFDAVPYRTANSLQDGSAVYWDNPNSPQSATVKKSLGGTYAHAESTTKVVENHPWARVACVIHLGSGLCV